LLVHLLNLAHFIRNPLTVLVDGAFLSFHPALHFFEVLPFVLNLSVLLRQYLLVVIKERLELIYLRFFQDLEPIERRSYLIRGRNL
jgi:hypothetical protein